MDIPETESDTLPEILESAKTTVQNVLPEKSKHKYMTAYNNFIQWISEKKTESMSQHTLLTYFKELSQLHKPSTLWGIYSMLRATIQFNNNLDIYKYDELNTFLKIQSRGFQSKKSSTLTPQQIKKFIDEAPDNKYLATKLATIFGICGACRREELTKIDIEDIEDKGSLLLIKIPTTKNYKPRTFVVTDEFYSTYKKYVKLRPKDIQTSRFFLNYQNGKCTQQPIGINKFGRMPKIIAKYLKLPDPDSYTSHTFRRTSATLLADSGVDILTLKRHGGWKSNTVAEGCVENSINNKMILEENKEREQSDTIEDEQAFAENQEDEKGEKMLPTNSLDIVNEEESRHSQISSSKVSNEDDRFGEWVALELRSLRSEVNKRKLKSEIRRAVCRIADLDDADTFPSNSSTDPLYLSSIPSPAYVSVCDLTNIKSEYNE
ncbi:uncharacterized protein LOC114940677 [Nylanderia fulva]|uniref:uncharacterized protein LOC114940677 n=1 Tax=Nylanderia fulva TaxID=613905 RepID=UPI0010FB35E3|nr:uncharacterized protein LOC114940677 [Nylanderia fulva]